MKQFFSRFPHFPSAIVLILSGPLYFLAYQSNETIRFDIGHWDDAILAGVETFYPPNNMSGPFRHSDNSVEFIEFVGRLTKREAGFQIPYHALRTPLQFYIRCHRFGLQGTVVLKVNGHHIQDFVFAKRSYPWGGIRASIPQEVAEIGPLRIELLTLGGDTPPSHLPDDVGLGMDWLEVTPMSRGVLLLPTTAQWFRFFFFLLFGHFFFRFLHTGPLSKAIALFTLAGFVSTMAIFYPVATSTTLVFAWLIFPLGIYVLWIRDLTNRQPPAISLRETGLQRRTS